jgi:hypothetical protein
MSPRPCPAGYGREARPLAALALSVVARLPYGRVYGITLPKSPFGKPINPMLFGRRNAVWNNECFSARVGGVTGRHIWFSSRRQSGARFVPNFTSA